MKRKFIQSRLIKSKLFLLIFLFPIILFSENFSPFTGKITGNKVRMRSSADLDSEILKQFNKGDLVLVVGEKDNFWKIAPPKDIKGYVFRSYLINDTIEANRVNLRLAPNTDSLIIGQLQQGQKINGEVYAKDNKWIEMNLPENIGFYIAKEYIDNFGKAEYFSEIQKRKEEVESLLSTAIASAKDQLQKSYEKMCIEEAVSEFEVIIKGYQDFPEYIQKAKEELSFLEDTYLKRKVKYLEEKNMLDTNSPTAHTNRDLSNQKALKNSNIIYEHDFFANKMKSWQSLEDALFTAWNAFHPDKKMDDFYEEQKINAVAIEGILQNFKPIKNRPGDYILLNEKNLPIAYLYSTKIELDKYLNKKIKAHVSPRPNNNFAFPAFFVNSVE